MKYLWISKLIFLGIFLSGCAGIAPQIYQFQNKETFNGSYDEVWTAVIETFAEKNIPIANMEKVSGFIATQEIRFTSEYADCGATPVGIKFNSLPVLGFFNVFVKEISPDNYNIAINSQFRVITDNPYYKKCTSTGELESWFLRTLRTKLKK
jgi:hypothetical protein